MNKLSLINLSGIEPVTSRQMPSSWLKCSVLWVQKLIVQICKLTADYSFPEVHVHQINFQYAGAREPK